MQIQKRWPVLFAICSLAGYIGNNYTVGGLEHLKLQPRQVDTHAGANNSFNAPTPFGAAATNGLPSTSPSWQTQNSGMDLIGSTLQGIDQASAWGERLGVGEKLALIQDQLSSKIADISRTQPAAIPPISLPSASLPTTLPTTGPEVRATNPPAFGGLPSSPLDASQRFVGTNSAPSKTHNQFAASNAPIMDAVPVIRIATFSLQSFGASHLAKAPVAEMLNGILRQFDLIALQGIQSERDDIVPILVERLNQAGRRFDYLIGPRVGPTGQFQQFAFLFDTSKVETDRYQLYTIDDPEQLMAFDPLVGWFRCRDTKSEKAFTFSLINIRVNRANLASEQSYIPNIFHAVSGDGRNEDDLILLGDFGGNPAHISKLNSNKIRFAVRDVPTDVSGKSMTDAIIFPTDGTTEFTGRAGVFDFLRRLNLSLEQAQEISTQMPVWAEFYVQEGAHPGRVAPASSQQVF